MSTQAPKPAYQRAITINRVVPDFNLTGFPCYVCLHEASVANRKGRQLPVVFQVEGNQFLVSNQNFNDLRFYADEELTVPLATYNWGYDAQVDVIQVTVPLVDNSGVFYLAYGEDN